MPIERLTKVLPIDANLDAEIQALIHEGWRQVPGHVPFATYELERNIDAIPAGTGGFGIDETKIFIIGPDGKPRE